MIFFYMEFCAKRENNVDTHMGVMIIIKATTRADTINIRVPSVVSALTEVQQ